MSQKQNILKLFLIAVFCLGSLGAGGEAEAALLFDGSFKPTDAPKGGYGSGGSFAGFGDVWDGWYCLPQPDSLVIVPAPGGRPGYAAKFTQRPGIDYDCGGSQHDQISWNANNIPNPNKVVWWGWSQYFDTTYNVSSVWSIIGWSPVSKFYTIPNTYVQIQPYSSSSNNSIFYNVNTQEGLILANHEKGVWYDWAMKVDFERDSTGYVEFWVKKPTDSDYVLLSSQYGFQTDYPYLTYETNWYMPRFGMYRGSASTVTQIIYYLNPKIGTTRADVEYGGVSTPDTIPPTITITCPPDNQTYSSNTISVSGTASDNVGVSRVQVKVGTGGTWQNATLTSPNAASTGWSINMSTIPGFVLSAGLNTIYARATDTAPAPGNSSPEHGEFIQVTYSTTAPPATSGIPAFPEAQGGGAESIGGRGGRVIHVTNLNSEGPGSLREAMYASGPRIVVFDVAGIIHLQRTAANPGGSIEVGNPYLTVAGQTAPGGGITVHGSIYINTHDTVVRFITVRLQPAPRNYMLYQAAISFGRGSSNIYNNIVDHVSGSWSSRTMMGAWSSTGVLHDITYQYILLAEGMRYPEGYAGYPAMLFSSIENVQNLYNISVHHNLMMKFTTRMPWAITKDVRIVNNLMYYRLWVFT